MYFTSAFVEWVLPFANMKRNKGLLKDITRLQGTDGLFHSSIRYHSISTHGMILFPGNILLALAELKRRLQ